MKKALNFLVIISITISCQFNDKNIKTLYYPTGELLAEIPLKDSVKHGKVLYYYKNGKIKHISHWVNGMQKNNTIEFDINGMEQKQDVVFIGNRFGEVGKDYLAKVTLNPNCGKFRAYFLCAVDYEDSLGFIQTKQAPGMPKFKMDNCMYEIIVYNDTAKFSFTPSRLGIQNYDLVITRVLDDDVMKFYNYQLETEIK